MFGKHHDMWRRCGSVFEDVDHDRRACGYEVRLMMAMNILFFYWDAGKAWTTWAT